MERWIERRIADEYRAALRAWESDPEIARYAATIGLSQRMYCDEYRRLNFAPITWTATTTSPPDVDNNRAYATALAEEGL